MHLDPRLGIVTIDLDACLVLSTLLEGEKNTNLRTAESQQYAVLSIPTNFPFSPPQIKTRA
jgi:hypothetical protein